MALITRNYVARRARLDALPVVSTSSLAGHECSHCQQIIIDTKVAFWNQTLPYDIDEALQAATYGCFWYGWLLNYVKRSGKPAEELDRERFVLDFEFKDSSFDGRAMWDILSITVRIGTLSYSWPCAKFDVYTESDNLAASLVSTRPVNRHVASEASLKIAEQWLAVCHSEHTVCRRYSHGILPNRVIDVTMQEDVDVVKLRSTVLDGLEISAKYTALSYCWGDDQPLKTTTSSLSRHMVNVSILELPKTLQDAIWVTRRLGIRFLWVDSLCIVQDDPEDIAMEVSRMAEYYENSFVTICAASASDCAQGFLHPRAKVPYLAGPFNLRCCCPKDQIGSVQLVQHRRFCTDEEVINSRGWTLQESLLSTRLLTYGARNLRWSCREAEFSDGGPWRVRYDLGLRYQWIQWQLNLESLELTSHWRMIVENYTRRTLKLPHDKLPAFSGIARRYQQVFKEHCGSRAKYLAGIWSVDIIRQLLWTTSLGIESGRALGLEHNRPRRPKHYRAPSWSWASVDGIVDHGDWDFIPSDRDWRVREFEDATWWPECSRANIFDFQLEPVIHHEPFGALRSGLLSIKARVISNRPDWMEFDLSPDTDEDRLQLERAVTTGHLNLLQLTRLEIFKNNPQTRPRGLILIESDACKDQYRRIGTFRLNRTSSCSERTYFDYVDPRIITLI